MKGFFSKSGGLLLIIAFLLTVLVGTTSVILKKSTDPITNVMGIVTSPIRNGVAAVTNWSEGVYAFLVNYQEMEQELSSLEIALAEMEQTVREGEEALRENAQLRELLNLQAKRRDFVFESAKVTARSFTGWESVLTVDKGRSAGVEQGDCVVTEAGHLVGIVTELGENWSNISTIVSTDIKIGGEIPRTGASGVLEGEFSLMAQNQVRLAYLTEDAQLVAGDQVLTSGRGGLYPEGLTVGKIRGVFDEDSGISRYAVIEPEVSFHNLVEVFVIKDFTIVN